MARFLKLIAWSDICFSWFASGHSFVAVVLSMLLGKKCVVVAGGYDVAYDPEINYGQYTLGRMSRKRTDFVLKHADLVLAVSNFTKSEAMARARPKRIVVLYNAVDTDKFRPASCNEKREDAVVTVASGLGDVVKLKGLEVYIKAAELLPNVKFFILGLTDENKQALKSMISSGNVKLYGYMSQEELLTYYQKAKVYCQLSYRESFGLATAEAMACGCVPVVTDRGALPEVVGTTGYFVPYGDPALTANAIKMALYSGKERDVRDRIKNNFGIELREDKMIGLLRNLLEEVGN
ncbi:MAG: glycosyltransferase family 4 protein [Methanothrix sp.]